jgi:hypothetical protein
MCWGWELTSNLLLLVVTVFDAGHEDGGLVREDQAVLDQVLVTRVQDSVQHGFVEEEVAHPLGYYDVDLVEGEHDLLHLALQQRDLVRHAVGLDNLARLLDDGRHVDANDVLCAGLDGEPVVLLSVFAGVLRGAAGVGCSNMLRMDVPHPTSRTTLSLNR